MQTEQTLDYAAVFAVLSELIEIGLAVVGPSGEIEFASARGRELLGCGDESDLKACSPEIREVVQEMIEITASGEARSIERQLHFERGGIEHDVALEVHPIDESFCSGFLVLLRDQANIRKMAADLRYSAQFRNTRRLYRSVVQQLKQPISAVMVHLDLLRDTFSGEQPDAERESAAVRSLAVIRSQVTELNHTLTLLLEEVSPAETEERGFSLRDAIYDVVRLVEPQADHQGVSIETHVDDHAARMSGSRQRVKQAILNIAINALDAMPEGGDLRIELRVTRDRAEVRIRDSGNGIAAGVLPHIFEVHYSTKNTGTGVGLYVARDVIRRHGGEIEVASEDGQGAQFVIRLPVSESPS